MKSLKKSISILLALLMTLSMFGVVASAVEYPEDWYDYEDYPVTISAVPVEGEGNYWFETAKVPEGYRTDYAYINFLENKLAFVPEAEDGSVLCVDARSAEYGKYLHEGVGEDDVAWVGYYAIAIPAGEANASAEGYCYDVAALSAALTEIGTEQALALKDNIGDFTFLYSYEYGLVFLSYSKFYYEIYAPEDEYDESVIYDPDICAAFANAIQTKVGYFEIALSEEDASWDTNYFWVESENIQKSFPAHYDEYDQYVEEGYFGVSKAYLKNDYSKLLIEYVDDTYEYFDSDDYEFNYLHRVGEFAPNRFAEDGFVFLPTSTEGLEDGDLYFDNPYFTAVYYNENTDVVKVVMSYFRSYTSETEEYAYLKDYVKTYSAQSGDPEPYNPYADFDYSGFALLPTSAEGLPKGARYFNLNNYLAALAAAGEYYANEIAKWSSSTLYIGDSDYYGENTEVIVLVDTNGNVVDVQPTAYGAVAYIAQAGVNSFEGFFPLPYSEEDANAETLFLYFNIEGVVDLVLTPDDERLAESYAFDHVDDEPYEDYEAALAAKAEEYATLTDEQKAAVKQAYMDEILFDGYLQRLDLAEEPTPEQKAEYFAAYQALTEEQIHELALYCAQAEFQEFTTNFGEFYINPQTLALRFDGPYGPLLGELDEENNQDGMYQTFMSCITMASQFNAITAAEETSVEAMLNPATVAVYAGEGVTNLAGATLAVDDTVAASAEEQAAVQGLVEAADESLQVSAMSAVDVSIMKDNAEIQPNGNVTLRLPVPAGYGEDNLALFHVDAQNGVEPVEDITVNGGIILATVGGFSTYIVAKVEAKPPVVEGFNQLPTADSEDLAEGAYWYDLSSAVDTLAACGFVEENEAEYFKASYVYLSEDGNTLLIYIPAEEDGFYFSRSTFSYLYTFLHQHGVVEPVFTSLPLADSDSLANGAYYLDAAAALAFAEDEGMGDEELAALAAAQYYINEDGTIIRMVSLSEMAMFSMDITEEDEDYGPMFNFVYQHVYVCPHANLTATEATAATCTTAGNSAYWTCDECGKYFSDAEAINEIEENSWVIDIDADAHNFGEMIAEQAATCTATGVKAHKVCEYCQKNFDAEGAEIADLTIAIVPTAHSFGEMIAEQAATCTATGVKAHKVCEYCQKNFDAEGAEIDDLTIPMVAHTFGEMIAEQAASCSAAGVKAHKVCSVCQKNFDANGVEIADLAIAKTAHSFGDWTTTKEATCTEEGSKTRSCANCDATETEKIEKTAHTYEDGVCTVCGAKEPQGKAALFTKIMEMVKNLIKIFVDFFKMFKK